MSAITESLRDAIVVDLQLLVASGHLVDLSNQRDADATLDTTVLNAAALKAATIVQRYLGRTADDDDPDAVEFGTRMTLLLLQTTYSIKLTDIGAAFVGGIYRELREEAKRRVQGIDTVELTSTADEFDSLDAKFPDMPSWDTDATS